jgi:hypothetical protein
MSIATTTGSIPTPSSTIVTVPTTTIPSIAEVTPTTSIAEVATAATIAKISTATTVSSTAMIKRTAARIESTPAAIPIRHDFDTAPSNERSRRLALLPGKP